MTYSVRLKTYTFQIMILSTVRFKIVFEYLPDDIDFEVDG